MLQFKLLLASVRDRGVYYLSNCFVEKEESTQTDVNASSSARAVINICNISIPCADFEIYLTLALGTQHFVFSQCNHFQICSGESSKGKEKSGGRLINKQEMVEKRLYITRITALQGHVFWCVILWTCMCIV